MSNFVYKVKNIITDYKRDVPRSRGNRASLGKYGSLDSCIIELDLKPYNSSSVNHSYGMGFNNLYGSRCSDDELGANHDSKGNGWFLLTYCSFPVLPIFNFMRLMNMGGYCLSRAISAGFEYVNSCSYDLKLVNTIDLHVDSDMGRSG